MARFVTVAQINEIPEQGGRCFEVEGKRIAVFNSDGEFYAIDDTCTHAEASLSEGFVEDCEVVCPWHAARFNLKTGEVTSPPAFENLSTYKVLVEGGEIRIEI